MKFPFSLFLFAGALGVVLAGCASPCGEPVTATRDRLLEIPIEARFLFDPADIWTLYVKRGDSREAVLTAYGRPEKVINRNLWVYWNCYSQSELARKGGCNTLLIAFTADVVTGLKLVNGEVLQSELAKQPGRAGQAIHSF
jgi:hypothetical protein